MYLDSNPTITLKETALSDSAHTARVCVTYFSENSSMPLIRDIVQQALITRYLSLEAEEQLRTMLKTKYETADFRAFMKLQYAVMKGKVRQEAREKIQAEI